jgi:hypothetical protein
VIQKYASCGLIVLVILLRISSVFSVYPNNAPDEMGHYSDAIATSQGRLLTLSGERQYAWCPYSLYNLTAYIPGAVALKITSYFDFAINELYKPTEMNSRAVPVLQLGPLVWFSLFLAFLLLLTQQGLLCSSTDYVPKRPTNIVSGFFVFVGSFRED